MHTEDVSTIRSCQRNEVVTSDVSDKVIGISVLIDNILTNAPHQEDQIITCQETIHIVKGLKVVEVEIEDAPGFHFAKLVVDCSHHLQATWQISKGRKIVLLCSSQLSAYTCK